MVEDGSRTSLQPVPRHPATRDWWAGRGCDHPHGFLTAGQQRVDDMQASVKAALFANSRTSIQRDRKDPSETQRISGVAQSISDKYQGRARLQVGVPYGLSRMQSSAHAVCEVALVQVGWTIS